MTVNVPSVAGASLPALGSTSLVLNKPTGTVDGDWLLVAIIISANTTVTPPAGGWATDLNVSGVKWFRKQASGEPASYTFTRGLATNTIMGTIIRVTGASALTIRAASSSASGTNVVIPTWTPGAGETVGLSIASILTNTSFTAPGGPAESFDQTYASESFTSVVGKETVTPGVALGTRTWVAANTGTNSGGSYGVVPVAPEEGTFTGGYNYAGNFVGAAGPGEGTFTGGYDYQGTFVGEAPGVASGGFTSGYDYTGTFVGSAPTPAGESLWTPGGANRFTGRRTPANRRRSR